MKISVTILGIIVCFNLNAQSDKNLSSKWFDNSTESVLPLASDFISAKKDKVYYCILNDDKNIYVNVKITESIEQSKVLQMGLTLWVNTDGKSRKITGIRYPLGVKYSKLQINRGDGQAGNTLPKFTPLSLANTIELIGFKDVETKRFPSNNPDNIRGTLKYDSEGNLLYSLTIPSLKLQVGSNSKEGLVPMTFAVEYGAPPSIAGGQTGGPSGNASSSGGGGRSGSRSGGGSRGSIGSGPSGGAPGAPDAPKAEIFWIKNIKLAEKK